MIKIYKFFVVVSVIFTVACEPEEHASDPVSNDTTTTVHIGKSQPAEAITAVYGAGSADISVDIEGELLNLTPEGSFTFYDFGALNNSTPILRNAVVVDEASGVHSNRSIMYRTEDENHSSTTSFFLAKEERSGGINLIGASTLVNWEDLSSSYEATQTIPIMPASLNVGDSWYSPVLYLAGGSISNFYPVLLSKNAVAPRSGIQGCYLFMYRSHFIFDGEYNVDAGYIYHHPELGVVDVITDYEFQNNNATVIEGFSVASASNGSGIINELTISNTTNSLGDIISTQEAEFSQSIVDTGTTGTYAFDLVSLIDADDPANPTAYDWVTINVTNSSKHNYRMQLSYPYTGYRLNFNTLTGAEYTGAFAPVLRVDIDNNGSWDYIADNTSDLMVRTEMPIEPFSINEPRNFTNIFIQGQLRSATGAAFAIPNDQVARTDRLINFNIEAVYDITNNGTPYVYVKGLSDNQLPDLSIGSSIPVRVHLENIADEVKAFDFQQFEVVWSTTEAGVLARDNVISYTDAEYTNINVAEHKFYLPSQSVAGRLYFQVNVVTNPAPLATNNQQLINQATPVYFVDIVNKSSSGLVAPKPHVYVYPKNGEAPLNVNIYAGGSVAGGGVIDRIEMDLGDGTIIEDAPTGGFASYAEDGEYKLKVTVVDNNGKSSVYTETIKVSSVGDLEIINSYSLAMTHVYIGDINQLIYGNLGENRISSNISPSGTITISDLPVGEHGVIIYFTDFTFISATINIESAGTGVIEIDEFDTFTYDPDAEAEANITCNNSACKDLLVFENKTLVFSYTDYTGFSYGDPSAPKYYDRLAMDRAVDVGSTGTITGMATSRQTYNGQITYVNNLDTSCRSVYSPPYEYLCVWNASNGSANAYLFYIDTVFTPGSFIGRTKYFSYAPVPENITPSMVLSSPNSIIESSSYN